MKLFAVGNYDHYDVYALVMEETAEDAISKLKNLKPGDTIDVDNTLDEDDVSDVNKWILAPNRIVEVPSGIFLAENA